MAQDLLWLSCDRNCTFSTQITIRFLVIRVNFTTRGLWTCVWRPRISTGHLNFDVRNRIPPWIAGFTKTSEMLTRMITFCSVTFRVLFHSFIFVVAISNVSHWTWWSCFTYTQNSWRFDVQVWCFRRTGGRWRWISELNVRFWLEQNFQVIEIVIN